MSNPLKQQKTTLGLPRPGKVQRTSATSQGPASQVKSGSYWVSSIMEMNQWYLVGGAITILKNMDDRQWEG